MKVIKRSLGENMKSIGVVTYIHNSPVARFLKENLETVFANFVNINLYSFDELQPEKWIDDDIVLVMIKSQVLEIKKHIADVRRIVIAQRTARESEIRKVYSLPADTKVLVVNDNVETTLEMVTLLYKLGINHLNLIPYEEEKEYSDVHIAITPGESWRVPASIGTVVDIGQRYIDISTFIEIINKLEIAESEVSRRLLQYCDRIVALDPGIKKQYKELVAKNTVLSAVINLSQEGILLLTTEGRVSLYNKSLVKMLDIAEEHFGENGEIALPTDAMAEIRQVQGKDEIVEYRGRTLVVNSKSLECFGEITGNYYNFQEVTYIKQLEKNLTQKLCDKGLVAKYSFEDIQTHSSTMLKCLELAKKMAYSEMTVLITGESGTGKELLAQSIHNASIRSKQPFVAFNCAAVPESLLESELFGYERGTFTGALKEGKAGLFEQANNGTIFLDEIGDMPYAMQAKLLRVLQERQVMRVGSQSVFNINIRVIAATNSNLSQKIRAGQFREDLYYRLNVLPVMIPPLRERTEDIDPLLQYFLTQKYGKILAIAADTKEILMKYRWPGNVRELDNVACYISFTADSVVKPDHLPHYMLNVKEDFQWEFNVLASGGDLEKCREVLQMIADFDSVDRGAGRKSIEVFLNKKGVCLTEGEIRRVLTLLNEFELIRTGIGRRGSEITMKGKVFLKWLKNRDK
jgi:transcriptional regulator with PAS, ATPase and Fis domain